MIRALVCLVLLTSFVADAQSKASDLIANYVLAEPTPANCSGSGRRCAGRLFTSSAPAGTAAIVVENQGAKLCLAGAVCTRYLFDNGGALATVGSLTVGSTMTAANVTSSGNVNVGANLQNLDASESLAMNDAEGFGFIGVATGSLATCNSTAPPTGTRGALQYDTTTNQLKLCNGTAWQDVVVNATSDGAEVSFSTDFASIGANTCNNFTVSGLTGLTMGDFCQASSDQVMVNNWQMTCQVVSTTQVRMEYCCNGTAACDAPSANYYMRVSKR